MDNLDVIRNFVTSPLVESLLFTHPNDLSVAVARPALPFREPWWAWAADAEACRWMQLFEYYTDPIQRTVPLEISSRGMSPKKAHEVTRSVAYISNLLRSLGVDPHGVRIVDVGAGQGYLTRTLQSHLGSTHLLALDSSEIQTQGAQRWQERTGITGSITQKNIHITPTTLCESIDEWIRHTSTQDEPEADPAPVLLVALHACGSLTPDLLRTFFIQQDVSKDRRLWTPIGVIAVGCCYNLLAPQDFPLSRRIKSTSPPIVLATSAYHMAAQIPAQWFRTPESRADATLAIRKVVWRAIVAARLAKTTKTNGEQEEDAVALDGTGDRPVMRRLGRLNNAVYTDWGTFARVAGERMGVDFGPDNELDAEERALISELEVLHVLRCIIGTVVESLIIADRQQWVQEHLDAREMYGVQVELVNLFDQATGSGRNVAMCIRPQ
ncbi:methyltransferase domain-containing protein [Mycena olivaceomarginata]|nr:methyltransferase domain-containing protein [Mycena olivaceomarginata]